MNWQVDHAAIRVESLARSREFYEYLGGHVVSKESPFFVEIVLGSLRLHVIRAKGRVAHHTAPSIDHLCVSVANYQELQEVARLVNQCQLIKKHGPFTIEDSPPLGADGKGPAEERPPWKVLYFRDPDGIQIEVRTYS